MNSEEIRRRFLSFFEKRGHAIIPSASLVPENDPSVLFTTAGMQPLVPYLLGEAHPKGKRLADIQKCVRTGDIDDVGDNRHLTFFEMMGNWSLGDYFKENAIKWSYEFLTSKEEGLGLDPIRLYVTIFEGDENAPLDEESKKIWMSLGIPEHRIYPLGAEDNWWSAGDNGPCGPDTEMFYDMDGGLGDLDKEEFRQAVKDEKAIEIWNDVFMEYLKKDGKVVGKLPQQNVDTGAGLERMTAVMQGKKTAYDTDLFAPIMAVTIPMSHDIRNRRIIADHFRTSSFMILDGVIPSNTDRGYVLRKLIRRAVASTANKRIDPKEVAALVDVVVSIYRNVYKELTEKSGYIKNVLSTEIDDYVGTEQTRIARGLKKTGLSNVLAELQQIHDSGPKAQSLSKGEPYKLIDSQELLNAYKITADKIFYLHSTEGLPISQIREMARDYGLREEDRFEEKLSSLIEKHKELSRKGAEQKFKGGLADTSEQSVRYHTATHLLHQALHDVLGDEVGQKGSNITTERLRFDFSFPRKMTDEEKQRVEDIVNAKIAEKLPVHKIVMPKAEAEKTGARHFFGEKYPDEVSVYYIGDSLENAYSKEFCGGPHVSNISELGHFKIIKEEAVSAGVRRIKAVLE